MGAIALRTGCATDSWSRPDPLSADQQSPVHDEQADDPRVERDGDREPNAQLPDDRDVRGPKLMKTAIMMTAAPFTMQRSCRPRAASLRLEPPPSRHRYVR
jgi:hypothetical protein